MTSDDDKFWESMVEKLRRASGFCSPTPEEAEAEMDAEGDEPMSEETLASIVAAVVSGKLTPRDPEPEWAEDIDTQAVEEGVFQLNRNLGDEDPETDRLLDELRRKALGDEETNGGGEPDGLDGAGAPPGDGR